MYELATSEVFLLDILNNWGKKYSYFSFEEKTKKLKKKRLPDKICKDAGRALLESLSKKTIRWLVTSGGWQNRVFLKDSVPQKGTVWNRYPDLENFCFSSFSYDLINYERRLLLGEKKNSLPEFKKLEIGDHLLLCMSSNQKFLPLWEKSPLCWLLKYDSFSKRKKATVPDFIDLIKNYPWVIESLSPLIIQRWIEIENKKSTMEEVDELYQLGQNQERLISSFLDACEELDRKDLSFILTSVAYSVLSLKDKNIPSSDFWVRKVQKTSQWEETSLSRKQEVFRSSGTLLKSLERVKQWGDEERKISSREGERYKKAKALLKLWYSMRKNQESIGTGFSVANRIYDELVEIQA